MVKVNNKEQRALFLNVTDNLSEEELTSMLNWGSELYSDGIIIGGILVGLGVLVDVAIHHLFRKRKNNKKIRAV